MPLLSKRTVAPTSKESKPDGDLRSVALGSQVKSGFGEAKLSFAAPLETATFLDTTNRATRTAIAWIKDTSPSVAEFHEGQWEINRTMIVDLRALPQTSRSLLFNSIQLGMPHTVSTGFQEIAAFELLPIQRCDSTPLHAALDRATAEFGAMFGRLRENGIERTQSVCIVSTDGEANGCTEAELRSSIARFREMCEARSVTPIVVGVGQSLNVPVLKALATVHSPIQLDQLRADVLTPFIEKLALSASKTRRGQDRIEFELPREMRPLG